MEEMLSFDFLESNNSTRPLQKVDTEITMSRFLNVLYVGNDKNMRMFKCEHPLRNREIRSAVYGTFPNSLLNSRKS